MERVFDVVVNEVHSGDDLIVTVDLGVAGLFKKVRARLKGVDVPSAHRLTKDTEAGKLRDELKEIIKKGNCRILLHNELKGGWLITLYVSIVDSTESIDVNKYFMDKGYVYSAPLLQQTV